MRNHNINLMSVDTDVNEQLKVDVLRKFYRKRTAVRYHIYESDIPKGFPPHLHKKIMNVAKELYRKGLLIRFPHGKEYAWQLNIKRIDEIKEIIRNFYEV